MHWTAAEYAARAGLPLRTARHRLARWHDTHAVRVVRETVAATSSAPPRSRYLLDVADWCAKTGRDPSEFGLEPLAKAA